MHVESAVAAWKLAVQTLPVDQHPKLWVGHYDETLKGSAWAPKITEKLVLILGSPFAVSDVSTTIIICDVLSHLSISRLMRDGTGVRDQHWYAPYNRADDGSLIFSLAMPSYPIPAVRGAIDALSEHRLMGTQHDFETAFGYAVAKGKDLL